MAKPLLEPIRPDQGQSFKMIISYGADACTYSNWHYHPEYELVFVSQGRGKRHIGNHISYFEEGDLIFLGPQIPHHGFCDQIKDDHIQIVIQLRDNFLGNALNDAPEFYRIKQLFEKSKQALSFYGETKKKVGANLLRMIHQPPFERLTTLLQAFHDLAQAQEVEILGADGTILQTTLPNNERLKQVHQLVTEKYDQAISLEEVAKLAGMTIPAFCRYFKQHTERTFTQFLNEFRISQACRWLGEHDIPVGNIAYDCGFNNLSHFNKQFKEVTGTTPSEYRKSLIGKSEKEIQVIVPSGEIF